MPLPRRSNRTTQTGRRPSHNSRTTPLPCSFLSVRSSVHHRTCCFGLLESALNWADFTMGNASANSNNKVGIGGTSTTTRRFHTLAISDRPRKSPLQFLNGFVFLFTFLFACVMINTFQLIFVLPLKAFPFSFTERLYDDAIRYTKGSFGALISASPVLPNERFHC